MPITAPKKRDTHTGEYLDPNADATDIATVNTDADANMALLDDTTTAPDVPIADNLVESFLVSIAENAVTGTDRLFVEYRRNNFPADAPEAILKSRMRQLLAKPRVRERLQYLRNLEWELNRPDILSISKRFEELIEDEIRPSDKILALNSLAKLVGLLGQKEAPKQAQVAIIFNSQEQPKDVTITQTP